MLVDGLKIGGRGHARAVIPVSAISVVAGARNKRYLAALSHAAGVDNTRESGLSLELVN